METGPRQATTVQQWIQDAKRESWDWARFYGQEPYKSQVGAAEALMKLTDEADYAWPTPGDLQRLARASVQM
eukprot:555232-Pyramimonas_sp.AAC.1